MALTATHNNQDILVPATRRGEPLVRSISQAQIEHESELGLAFAFPSANADINAGDSILTIKNTSDSFLVLTSAIFLPANVACQYDIGIGATTTALVGTAVTALNMNEEFSTKTFDHEVKSDETAIADANVMFRVMTNTTDSLRTTLDGIILGKNHFIQINQETECTSGAVTVFGFFIPELQ